MTTLPSGHEPARANRARWFEPWVQDLRYAVRGLLKTPGFTVTVIVVLALGVGANAAMFSLVDHLFFREPPGIVDPASVVTATEVFGMGYSPAMDPEVITAVRTSVQRLATMALATQVVQGLDHATGPRVFEVSSNYFSLLGVRMFRGRPFSPEEAADSIPVAIVSYRYWERTLHGDSAALGRDIELLGRRYALVGIAAPEFTGTTIEATDIWLPLSPDGEGTPILRLAPGVTRERVQAAMTVALNRVRPPRSGSTFRPEIVASPLVFGRQDLGGPRPGLTLVVRVAGVAAIILLIAVANFATLLLMRATRRRREIAVRLALGVSRGRLVRQLLVEGVLLSTVAAAAGIVAGVWGGAVTRAEFFSFYRLSYPVLDWRFVGFTVGIAVAAGVVASLAPAFKASRPDLAQTLRTSERGLYRRSWLRGSLVVLQAALSVVLVVGAALFVQSLRRIHDVPLGIDVDHLMFAMARFDQRTTARAYLPTLSQEADRLRGIPGVQQVALADFPPLMGLIGARFFRSNGDTLAMVENGKEVGEGGNAVTPGYFQAVGMHLLDGRDFTPSDTRDRPPVMIVGQTLARIAWPGQRAVGQCLINGRPTDPCAEVVGVVSDANLSSIKPEPRAAFYVPMTQHDPLMGAAIVVRADESTRRALVKTVQRDLRAALPPTTTLMVADLKATVDPRYAQWTQGAAVFSAMGLLALIVSAVGMYSVIAYAVSEHMHEMGVRVALGARRAQVMRPVMLGGVKLAAIGVIVGVGASLMMGRLVTSLLYDTSAHDPVSLLAAALVLLVTAAAASYIPARRASRVDPVEALRAE